MEATYLSGSGMDDSRVSEFEPWQWILITIMLWPLWHLFCTSLSAYPVSWLASITMPVEQVGSGGVYDNVLQPIVLAATGFLFGFLGVRFLRRAGAPRAVWIPAALVSMCIYLGVTLVWAGFSGSGTGAVHIAGQFALAVGLAACIGAGAWFGARGPASA
jgi:hypothetical protein